MLRLSKASIKKLILFRVVALLMIVQLLTVTILAGATPANAQTPPWPTTPPAQICGNSSILGNGPEEAPEGAVVVPAGDNIDMFYDFRVEGTTFWFEPGVHTLGTDQFGQINPGDDTTFIGAPGAIIDGQDLNKYAFTGEAEGVTVKYLTIQNFAAPMNEGVVNHNDGKGWTIEYNTIKDNGGAGVMIGAPDNTYRYNCIKDNGQYGINGCCGTEEDEVQNIVIDHNEITGNNTDDWETQQPGCGCTGGIKFWLNKDVTVTNNYIHDNHGAGLWLDNNNRGFRIENNYIADNDAEGLFMEAGYDAQVRYNYFKGNNIEPGRHRAANGDFFPVGAIYVSESGSPEGYSSHGIQYVPTVISYNKFEDNWGGVILWESPDRYSGSSAHTHSSGTVKIGDIYDLTTCDGPNDTIPNTVTDPYDCRWSTENIVVEHNEFHIDKTAIGEDCDGGTFCGINALFSSYGTYPPFPGYEIPTKITFEQGNIFRNNDYYGDWRFAGFERKKVDGSRVTWAEWTAAAPTPPYNFNSSVYPTTFGQDQGSTYTNNTPTGTPTPTPTAGPTATPTPTPTPQGPVANHLDANSATFEGALGHWDEWFSTAISRVTDEYHSGTASMKVDITDGGGWGVTGDNWPGFDATPGEKVLSFWAKAGSGTPTPTMTVKWFDNSNNLLQTDTVTLSPLTSSWQKASAYVTAPAGTVTVFVTIAGPGSSGNSFYIDDITVGDVMNAVDNDTATLESSIGQWEPWYSADVTRSSEAAHTGTYSLKAEVTDLWGWGATLGNWPGFEVAPGVKRISYWAKRGAGDIADVTLRAKWLDSEGELIQTDEVPVSSLTTSWQQGVADVIAPTGAVNVFLELYSESGDVDESVYVDDISITNITNLVNVDTSSFESSLGEWANWYSATLSTSTSDAYFGTKSLLVTVTDLWGWGAALDNWPGFAITPGPKRVTFAAKQGSGNIADVTLRVKWFDAEDELLQTNEVPMTSLTTTWKQAGNQFTAPAGTAKAYLELDSDTGAVDDTLFIDGIIIAEVEN